MNDSEIRIYQARKNMLAFTNVLKPNISLQEHYHQVYYYALDRFAKGKIKKMMVSMPPQHGKSEGSSRILPAFMLGISPEKKIAIGSYSAGIAQDFNRDVQRIMMESDYVKVFPGTRINSRNVASDARGFLRNSNVVEIVDTGGWLRAVGRAGALTSKTVDVMIMDDIYKDYDEGNSPTIREKAWKWYVDVVRSRLHNESQELIVFTRWNEDDLIGRLEEREEVIVVNSISDLHNIPEDAWVKINFEAIKESKPTEFDPRQENTALWEAKHSLRKLRAKRNLDEHEFDCLYQGAPGSKVGMLYKEFKTYKTVEEYGTLVAKNNYTDVADSGDDYLLSISYDVVNGKDSLGMPIKYLLVQDMVYTDEPVEVTMESVPMLLKRANTKLARIESNAGGRTFAVTVQKTIRVIKANCEVSWFHQGDNKESRITTNAGLVNLHVIMPHDWRTRFESFYKDVTKYKRMFASNKHDDVADVLTGMIEKEILQADFVVC